jgi:hypothetical protein
MSNCTFERSKRLANFGLVDFTPWYLAVSVRDIKTGGFEKKVKQPKSAIRIFFASPFPNQINFFVSGCDVCINTGGRVHTYYHQTETPHCQVLLEILQVNYCNCIFDQMDSLNIWKTLSSRIIMDIS